MLKLNEIHCGDSEELLKEIDDNSIDLIVTSPPYSNLRHYGNTLKEWNHDKFKRIADELYRVLKDGGVLVWNVGDKTEKGTETCIPFKQVLYFRETGLNLNDTMIWLKENPMPEVYQPRYRQQFEYMFVFSKGKPKTFNPLMRKCKESGKHYTSTVRVINTDNDRKDIDYFVSDETIDYNVWKMSVAQNKRLFEINGKQIKHPAVFPLDLPLKHILSWTNEGDIVLDPFAGSGTTAIAAIKTKRNYIGLELNKEYVDIANILIKEENGKSE